jgi:hypothetical protein
MCTMSLAGICFLVFAGFTVIQSPLWGLPIALFLVALAGVSFWLASRARR